MGESWHLARDGELVGIFPAAEIVEGLSGGRFLPEDLVWQPGREDWRPVASVAELVRPALAAARAVVDDGPAWEWRSRLGWGPALLQTALAVLESPGQTFARMRRAGPLRSPILFLLLLGWPTAVLSSLFLERVDFTLLRESGLLPAEAVALFAGESMLLVVGLLVTPAVLVLGQFAGASVIHLSLWLVGAARQPWRTTFRVSCYVAGATAPLQLVPGVGWLLAWVWSAAATVIGLSRAHGVGTGPVLLGLSVPPLVILTVIVSFVLGRFVF